MASVQSMPELPMIDANGELIVHPLMEHVCTILQAMPAATELEKIKAWKYMCVQFMVWQKQDPRIVESLNVAATDKKIMFCTKDDYVFKTLEVATGKVEAKQEEWLRLNNALTQQKTGEVVYKHIPSGGYACSKKEMLYLQLEDWGKQGEVVILKDTIRTFKHEGRKFKRLTVAVPTYGNPMSAVEMLFGNVVGGTTFIFDPKTYEKVYPVLTQKYRIV